LKSNKNINEPYFVQALLNPKNTLFYVLDSCLSFLNEKNIIRLYEKILSEVLKNLKAKKGVFYLNIKKNNHFEMINYLGISEKELKKWENLNKSVKDKLKVSNKAFFETLNGKKVNLNSVIIPIYYKDRLYALVKAAKKVRADKFSKLDLDIANHMIDYINISIENAKDASSTKKDTLRLRNRRTFKISYFYEFFSNELKRAKRYKKTFSLIYFKIENFNLIKERFHEEAIKDSINNLVDKLNLAIRETDFIAEESDSRYFLILPETDYFGSLMAMRKIDSFLANDLFINDGEKKIPLSVKMSSASYPKDGESAKGILEALSSRLEIAKSSITEKLDIKNMTFWEIIEELTANGEDEKTIALNKNKVAISSLNDDIKDEKGAIRFSTFHPMIIRQLENTIFRETIINSDRRGIIYVGDSNPDNTFSVLKNLPDFEHSKSRLFLITKQCIKDVVFPNITYIFTSDPIIPNYYFIIYLNERYSYGIFAKKRAKGAYYGFHTSDSVFVEDLIVKLQNHYLLQEQL
jgi:diguanylate cyclase (GGDEF)-like protein